MNLVTFRWLCVLLGFLAVAGVARQFAASHAARSNLETEGERQEGLNDQLALISRRLDLRLSALEQFADGRVGLAEVARQFRAADAWDPVAAERVRRTWPDAPSDDERYAAEVVHCLRERARMRVSEVAVLVRAEADFWQEFGRSPNPVG